MRNLLQKRCLINSNKKTCLFLVAYLFCWNQNVKATLVPLLVLVLFLKFCLLLYFSVAFSAFVLYG